MRGRLVEYKEFSCASEDEGVLELRKIRFQECRDGLLLPEETSTISRDISISNHCLNFPHINFGYPSQRIYPDFIQKTVAYSSPLPIMGLRAYLLPYLLEIF